MPEIEDIDRIPGERYLIRMSFILKFEELNVLNIGRLFPLYLGKELVTALMDDSSAEEVAPVPFRTCQANFKHKLLVAPQPNHSNLNARQEVNSMYGKQQL